MNDYGKGSMSADNDPVFQPVDDPELLARAQAVLDAKGVQAQAYGSTPPSDPSEGSQAALAAAKARHPAGGRGRPQGRPQAGFKPPGWWVRRSLHWRRGPR